MDVKSLLPLCFLMFITSITSSRRIRNRKGLREKFTDQGTCELEISCKGIIKTPVRLPIKGPRGPPGIPGEKGATGLPGVPGIPGKPGKSPPSIPTQLSQRTAFFVGLDKNYIPNNSTNVLAYTKVITNEGEAYDSSTGRFTAPVNGTYHFTVVVAAKIRQKAAVMLMVERRMIFTVWAESIPMWSTASNSAILQLSQGEQVWLVVHQHFTALYGYMYSSFSGFILYQNNDNSD